MAKCNRGPQGFRFLIPSFCHIYTNYIPKYYFVLQGDCETLLKKIEEVRLLESRKSARLINSDTDFSKLADLNISQISNVTAAEQARKAISKAIEVPQRSDYVQIAG